MSGFDKTKKQMMNELAELRQRIAKLKTSESEHKRAEEELRRSEEKYRSLVSNIPDVVALLNKKRV
jgi:PAS domain-containing protein